MESFTAREVALHNTADDCWLIIQDRVYDVTDWLPYHPGSSSTILPYAGMDVTAFFERTHHSVCSEAWDMKEDMCIGQLIEESDLNPIEEEIPPSEDMWAVCGSLFLPSRLPQTELPEALGFLQHLAESLPVKLTNGSFRQAMEKVFTIMPVSSADCEKLISTLSQAEAELLLLITGLLSMAYVHGSPGEDPRSVPAPLAILWSVVANSLGRRPMMDYASIVLANWRLTAAGEALLQSGKPLQEVITADERNTRALFTFTGSEDEECFYRTHLRIEASMARCEGPFKRVHSALASPSSIHETLEILHLSLETMQDVLRDQADLWPTLHQGCNPFVYFYRMRRYLMSFHDVEYETMGKKSFPGPTGAQSCLLRAVDAVLGVPEPEGALRETLDSIRGFTPDLHSEFLQTLRENKTGGVQGYLKQLRTLESRQDVALLEDVVRLFNGCVAALVKIREGHLSFVTKYILEQMPQGFRMQGTGGTALAGKPGQEEREGEKSKSDGGSSNPLEMLGRQANITQSIMVEIIRTNTEEGDQPSVLLMNVAKERLARVMSQVSVQRNTRMEAVVTPWSVRGEVDPEKLIKEYGCTPIDTALIDRIERITGQKAHRFLRRGFFNSHRDLHELLDAYEQGEPFYIYTGRGPSSGGIHIGHLLPFEFSAWLQQVFRAPVVIQMTDDEKFLFRRNLSQKALRHMLQENARDIIACGFDPHSTFIFSDFDYMGRMYREVVSIENFVTTNQAFSIYGFTMSDSIGKIRFPATQAAPCFSNSFPHIFPPNSNMYCLVPQAIDQDPYFRMTRDVAGRLGYRKPSLIHCRFLPGLQGAQSKMSASNASSSVFLTDTGSQIRSKVMRAHSGGKETLEEQRKEGANLASYVAFQWLTAIMESDEELLDIGERYSRGLMLTGEVKEKLIEELCRVLGEHQKARSQVTDAVLQMYMAERPLGSITRGQSIAREVALK